MTTKEDKVDINELYRVYCELLGTVELCRMRFKELEASTTLCTLTMKRLLAEMEEESE